MIRTATQLKAKVRNLSGGDSKKAQTLIRNFIMERFLERIALSQYRNNFILKGALPIWSVSWSGSLFPGIAFHPEGRYAGGGSRRSGYESDDGH